MRRLLGVALALSLMAVTNSALASEEYGTYRDEFNAVKYSGSDGTLWWDQPWVEIGESDGPSAGAVHITPDEYCEDWQCLHIHGEGGEVSGVGAKRFADASVFSDAEICYGLKSYVYEQFEGVGGDILVQVTGDGGNNWTTIDSFSIDNLWDNPVHRQKGINNWLTEAFGVRFLFTGLLGGEVFVDNVEIKGAIDTGSTATTQPTTTTTKPKTTTTRPTTTTAPTTTITTQPAETTTTTSPTTTTTEPALVSPPPSDRPPGSGLRDTGRGVAADFDPALYGGMDMEMPDVLSVEVTPEYLMAVEVIESSWIWMLGLALLIAAAIVTGLDRRRAPLGV
jgi:hypothetical protein